MIHLKTTCDQRRTRKDGTHPIVFRITVKGKSRDISSGFSCNSTDWDYKNNVVRGQNEELMTLYRRVADKELDLLQKIRDYEKECPFVYDVQDVRNYLSNKKANGNTVKAFWLEEIDRMHRAKRHSNARNYESALLGLEKGVSMDIPFDKINYAWLVNTETLMRERGLKTTSVSVYYRTLRSIYNRAINMDVVNADLYPFRRYKIKTGTSRPRSLSLDEMRKFFSYQPTSDMLRYAHDMGRLIFMLRGINYTDLALLTKENVRNGRIVYHRSKTKKLYSVKIHEEAQTILDCYASVGEDTLLSLLSEDEYRDVQHLPLVINQKIKVLNKWLRKIGAQLELEEQLSTYVYRYSHAQICREVGFSKDMISQSLGHQNGLKVTDAYLNDYDLILIDGMNQNVINKVLEKK